MGAPLSERQAIEREKMKECVATIESGTFADETSIEFLSMDLEMTGITGCDEVRSSKNMSMDELFIQQRKGAEDYALIQLGVCLAGRKKDVWKLQPYNFYLFPTRKRNVAVNTMSLKFLVEHGISLDDWVTKGVDYETLNDIETEKDLAPDARRILSSEAEEAGAQNIIRAIMQRDPPVPVVFHNGLLDMLHILDKFVGRVDVLAHDLSLFGQSVTKTFPGGVYDTKYIAKQGLIQYADKGTQLGALEDALVRHGTQNQKLTSTTEIVGHWPESQTYKSKQKAHEAGFDALSTAKVFILELDHILCDAADTASHFSLTCWDDTQAGRCEMCLKDSICLRWDGFMANEHLKNHLDFRQPPGAVTIPRATKKELRSRLHTEKVSRKVPLKPQRQVKSNRPPIKVEPSFTNHKNLSWIG